ncbi:uncharacterized protein LOC129287294 isoform X2 [Prosopis cineraria]|uniref:uncharacterized protein LOC129287294 isoform X2 n=1 Tax=Prosopis cineraria TaxID=364024 RepID=UPI00240EC6F3|nr:uncharacterized protein LOC129287294 isoform X2 [Prosopis cineraria]
MAEVGATRAAAARCTEILIDIVMKELPYLCCYKSYAINFERKKEELSAAVESLGIKLEEAKTRNETQIDPIIKQWVQRAESLIGKKTRPKKWFGLCTNYFSQHSQAKELERMTQEIPMMMEKAENFSQVAHSVGHPGMQFYSQELFIHFESRKSIFRQLKEELEDDSKYRIGLQAMGGSGKTTMAKAVGKELETSKAFNKVIFIKVPNPLDKKKIQDEIAKKLGLQLEDEKSLTHAEQIWNRIDNAGNILIILDDVWKELNLENIGIHHGIHSKGRCCILLTTRYEMVCTSMRCQHMIQLKVLPEEDALDLFLFHASENGNDCPNRMKVVASKIVNECGRLPVIVVAVAKTIRNWYSNEWEVAFAAMEKDARFRHEIADEEAKKFYNSLRISFKCLDKRVQDFFLLCSIFPRAYEIPVELLSRIAIGLGLCGDVDNFCTARSQFLPIKNTLVSSALLLTAGEGCVKMHDVIRDVAQHIANEKIQVIANSETKLKENTKYSCWITNDFSNHFEGSSLEALLVWVNANGSLNVPNEFFGGIKHLRVLLLYSKIEFERTLALSLPKSIESLENIQTLSLTNWNLGDISIWRNLKKLRTLELTNCSIIELPNDISQLEKLRLLALVCCSIKKMNPFEVVGRCSKLEELYYVSNDDTLNINAKPSKISVLQEFGTYYIEGRSSMRSFQLDASTKRYFNSTKLRGILSENTVKSLAARAEILELTECNEIKWTNLIPDMVQIEDGGMNDLIRLCLRSWPAIQCLICTNGIQSDATIFSNLVELQLHDMHVRELCRGDYPNGFLMQLEKLDLSHCVELDDTLFKGKLELSNLKSIQIVDCSMTCLFHPSAAQSLNQLENLYIKRCSMLEQIISDDERLEEKKVNDHHVLNQKIHDTVLPKLKFLKVQDCPEVEFILPICSCKLLESVKINGCDKLRYIFEQGLKEGGLYQMGNEIIIPLLIEIEIVNVPKLINIYPEYHLSKPSQLQKSWSPLCCLSKSSASSKDDPSFSKATRLDHTQALKEKYLLNKAHGLFTSLLYPYKNLRMMRLEGFPELRSLFTLSVASSLKLLKKLEVKECDALEHIVIDERHYGHDHTTVNSIFPKLQQVHVWRCSHLESIFPAFYSNDFMDLEYVNIRMVEKLKHVFGKCHIDQKRNDRIELNLPALKQLYLVDVPNMVSICAENYHVKALSLQVISLEKCLQLHSKTVGDLLADVQRKKQDFPKGKLRLFSTSFLAEFSCQQGENKFTFLYVIQASKAKSVPGNTIHGHFSPPLSQCNLIEIKIIGFSKLTSLFTLSVASSLKLLEILEVHKCDALEHIVTDEGHYGSDHLNVSSIFPNLRQVYVWECSHLEYIFPDFYSRDLTDLEAINIRSVEKMKYVFGKCHADQNHNVQIELNFPAIKTLYLYGLPSVVGICVENYHVKALHVEDISLKHCPQLPIKFFIDFLVGEHKRQDLSRRKEKGKALSNLQELPESGDVCVGPTNYLSFWNLSTLIIKGCKQLKFILSASTSRCLPRLRMLVVSLCEELVSIIEDEDNEQNAMGLHQVCFPELSVLQVKHCKSLKCLFSISTYGKLPRLSFLSIEDAPELVQVFRWNEGMPPDLAMKDVLPNLFSMQLVNLPTLHAQGIGFPIVKNCLVHDCNNIPSANASSSESCISSHAFERHEEESKEALEKDRTMLEQNSSPNLVKIEEVSKEGFEKDSTDSSLNLTEIEETVGASVLKSQKSEEVVLADEAKDLELSNVHSPFSSTLQSESPQELRGKESVAGQQALGESRSSNEASQRVEEPANQCSSKEISLKMALAIPPSIIGMTSPQPQIATSATQVDLGCSKSDLLHISAISDQSVQIEEEGSENIIREDSARLEHANASPNLENSEEASKRIAEKTPLRTNRAVICQI